MDSYADLEIGLHRRDADIYTIEMRFSAPDSDTDIRVSSNGPAVAEFDREQLLVHQLDPAAYGRALGESLFTAPEARDLFMQARAVADADDEPLRLRILIGQSAPELHGLRWETLRVGDDDSFLSTKENVLFSRYLSSTDWRPVRLRAKAALRALVVISNPTNLADNGLAVVDVAGELKRAKSGLGDEIEITELASGGSATIDNMISHLRSGYDILYFAGHGKLLKGNPFLWLENADGTFNRISATDFITRLQELRERPRLIVLASCESAGKGEEPATADDGALSALGPRLAEVGIPAVLAMQGNISMETVARFMPVFFAELTRDGIIDRAMAAARGAVRDRDDWWAPTLFMRMKSARIWYIPGFSDSRSELEQWKSLVRNIDRQKVTPILGPGLSESILGPRHTVALNWAKTYNFPMSPHDQEALPQVTQFIAVNHGEMFARDELIDYQRQEMVKWIQEHSEYATDSALSEELKAATKPKAPMSSLFSAVWKLRQLENPLDPYWVLAQTPFALYITTDPTDLLRDALTAAGRAPKVEFCRWNEYIEDLPSIYEDEPNYRPSEAEPLIYHLFGIVDEPESLVLTEDDYFEYLIGVTSNNDLIPEFVRRSLVDTALLFLGFRLDEWDFRVLFRSIMKREGRQRRGRYAHIGAQVNPEEGRILEPERAREYLESYFGNADINLFWGRVEDFIAELSQRIQK
ncbi:MAG: CHAT domain-containing protein [Caldilineaceae bacterium]